MTLLGTVFISAAAAAVAAIGLGTALGASFWIGLLIYSLVGASALILLSWRKFVQAERSEENGHWVGSNAHQGYASLTAETRSR